MDSELANISSRGLVQTGNEVMIGGFIIAGGAPQKVIVRAIGPSLPARGALADSTLELFYSNGDSLGFHNNWRDTPAAFTAVVRDENETIGVALVEVYPLA